MPTLWIVADGERVATLSDRTVAEEARFCGSFATTEADDARALPTGTLITPAALSDCEPPEAIELNAVSPISAIALSVPDVETDDDALACAVPDAARFTTNAVGVDTTPDAAAC